MYNTTSIGVWSNSLYRVLSNREVYNCIREIPGKVEVIWAWVKSSDNAADIASRITATPMDLVEGSVWQDGPAYLKLLDSEWPLRTDIMSGTVELPSEELRKQYKHFPFHITASSASSHPVTSSSKDKHSKPQA